MSQAGPVNAQQITYWNEVSGPKWVALSDLIDAQIAPLGREAIDRAAPSPGERVLDVGCGCGQTTVDLARRVGPSGEVVGVDVSRPMLADAERRAAAAPEAPVRFLPADAQTHPFDPGAFDLVFSRFGVMFFEDPAAAFANLARALRPGGRIVFACWQALDRNAWMRVPVAVAARHLSLPAPGDPHAPGPFAFADAERLRGLVTAAGLADVVAEPLERDLVVGAGLEMEAIVDFLLQMGPTGAALRDASDELVATVRASLHEAMAPYHRGDGLVMGAAAWLVSARRPGQAPSKTQAPLNI